MPYENTESPATKTTGLTIFFIVLVVVGFLLIWVLFGSPFPTKAENSLRTQTNMPLLFARTIHPANVHIDPAYGHNVVTTLSAGIIVQVFKKLSDWYEVEYQDGRWGYIPADNLSLIRAASSGYEPIPGIRLRPEHEQALKDAGWLSYVTVNVDAVIYEPGSSFRTDNGTEVIGLAQVIDGRRIARIARDVDLHTALEAIIHEAAHHEIRNKTGEWGSEDYCKLAERQFLQDYKIVLESRDLNSTSIGEP